MTNDEKIEEIEKQWLIYEDLQIRLHSNFMWGYMIKDGGIKQGFAHGYATARGWDKDD